MNGRPSRKWLGVSGNMSLMSQLTWVSGLELMRPSHSTSTVKKYRWTDCPILNSIKRHV